MKCKFLDYVKLVVVILIGHSTGRPDASQLLIQLLGRVNDRARGRVLAPAARVDRGPKRGVAGLSRCAHPGRRGLYTAVGQ